jgi:hypothetical protein
VNGITISHRIDQSLSGFYINGGLLARVTARMELAFVFRTSYDRKSKSRSQLRYSAAQAGTDILIEAASDDLYHQPWLVGLGLRYELSSRLRLLGDLTYFRWTGYRVLYFGEKVNRDFVPALKPAVGAEYDAPIRLFRTTASVPLRLGLGFDPQPMRSPSSAYTVFSLGTGIHFRTLGFDIGGQIGLESGSGRGLSAGRLCVSLTIRP